MFNKLPVYQNSGTFKYKIDLQNIYDLSDYLGNPHFQCQYTSVGQPCNPIFQQGPRSPELGEISFYGEVFGEPQEPQEVEIGLLIRSPEEHGTSPVAQTFNLGNRPVVTNDNYIRDSYSISALIRNSYYAM